MTTSVSGPLRLVTDVPAVLVQVMVRAPRPRPHAGGMVVDFTTPASVADGVVSFPCVPGPAVLVVVNARVPQVTVPLVVPDKPSATLEECISAAELADTATRSELEDLARRVVEGVSQAESSAAAAQESAAAAGTDAREVASAREAVEGYRLEVTAAHGETLMARDTAVGAADTATAQAETATDRAGAAAEFAAAAGESEASAAESAQEATRQADRASQAAGTAAADATRSVEQRLDDKVTAAGDHEAEAKRHAGKAGGHAADAKAAAEHVDSVAADAAEAVRAEVSDDADRADRAATRAEQHEAGAAAAAAAEVSKLKGDAPEAFDTLEEIAEELAQNETERAALANSIGEKARREEVDTALAAKSDIGHGHEVGDVSGLQSALDGKAAKGYVDERTPKIVTVTALPASPDPSTVYLVKG